MICRLCLEDFVNVINIFDLGGRKMNVAAVVRKHFWFEPRDDDPISTTICSSCWLKLSNFHEFYKSVEQAHRKLAERFLVKTEPKDHSCHPIHMDNIPVEVVYSLPTKIEPCDDNDLNDDVDELYEVPLNVSADVDLTKETNNLPNNTHNLETNTVSSSPLINQQQASTKANSDVDVDVSSHCELKFGDEILLENLLQGQLNANNECLKQDNPIDIDSLPRRSTRLTALKNTNLHSYPNSQDIIDSDDLNPKLKCVLPSHRDETTTSIQSSTISSEDIDDIDQQITKYMTLICDLCNKEFMNFSMLKKHMSGEHKTEGYAKCCNKKFLKRVLLMDHIRKHLNPDCYKCEECNRIFADKQTMRNHFLIKHQKDEDKIHKCQQCPKKFVKKYLLMHHSMLAHVDRSTTCKNCNKKFDTIALLNAHAKERCNYGIMCDICAKVIRGREAFKRHQLEHAGVTLPKVQCDECGSWHKDKYTLNKHKKRHSESQIPHICDICQKVSPSRAAMLSHKRYVHNADPTFECNVCHKTFKRLIYWREHMATHTGEILYNCPHCTRTFNSNANMHSHRKRAHPKEFEEARKLRRANISLDTTNSVLSNSIDLSTTLVCAEENNDLNPQHLITTNPKLNVEQDDGSKGKLMDKQTTKRNGFLHKQQEDENMIYKCQQCSKSFSKQFLLIQHNKVSHKDKTSTCKHCNRKFDTVAQLNLHAKQLCGHGNQLDDGVTLLKVQCDECGSWHKDKHNLSEHKKRHRESQMIHTCDMCQKISPSRSALLSHKRLVHNTSRIFECDVCKKTFKRLIYWREHIATHTGEVLYRCPHCTRTFNSNGNMHSHRKKAHPKEFEALRKLRRENAHLNQPPVPSISELSSVQTNTSHTSALISFFNNNTTNQPILRYETTSESNNNNHVQNEC